MKKYCYKFTYPVYSEKAFISKIDIYHLCEGFEREWILIEKRMNRWFLDTWHVGNLAFCASDLATTFLKAQCWKQLNHAAEQEQLIWLSYIWQHYDSVHTITSLLMFSAGALPYERLSLKYLFLYLQSPDWSVKSSTFVAIFDVNVCRPLEDTC